MTSRMVDAFFRFQEKRGRPNSATPSSLRPRSRSRSRSESSGVAPMSGGIFSPVLNFSPIHVANNSAFKEALTPKLIRGADLDSSARHPPPRCQAGTRINPLRDMIYRLSDDMRQCGLFWITGPAGSGKSAIAQTFAELCQEAGELGAALFLSHTYHKNDFSLIIPTIVYQLATQNSAFKDIVTRVLKADPLILERGLPTLFKKLIQDPAHTLQSNFLTTTPLVIVLDGLNECGDRVSQLELIELISDFNRSHDPNSPFLWIICTRPEPDLMKALAKLKSNHGAYCGSATLDIDDADSIKDVIKVFRTAFDDIRQRYSDMFDLTEWPTEEQLQCLIDATSGFFFLVSDIIQFIGDNERRDPVAQLEVCLDFLNSPSSSRRPNPFYSLDIFYQQILSNVHEDILPMTLNILRLCVSNSDGSYTVQNIQASLGINQFYRALRDLHSLIYVPSPEKAHTEGPQFYHSSFADFLSDKNRSGNYCIYTGDESLQNIPSHSGVEASAAPHSVGPRGVAVADIVGNPSCLSSGDYAPVVDSDKSTQQAIADDLDAKTGPTLSNPSQLAISNQRSEVTALLSSVLKTSRLRKALLNLKGGRAQLVIDYLHSVLLEPSLPPWLRKHSLVALRGLSKASLVYPHCYVLKDIDVGPRRDGGAFSDVHEGRYGEQRLCLKVVRLHQKSEAEALLKVYAKEAIVWGQLRHPNVVPFFGIYYLNETREQVCLVSPWMQNGNLVSYLKNKPSAPRPLFAYDIAAGLGYLHDQSLVHSDIKGMNILVDDSERACITDFGLTVIRTDQTLAYTFAGTTTRGFSCHWAAPELLEDDARPTLASDVWALGMVFYEILTGSLPYGAATDVQIMRKIWRGELPIRPDPASSSGSAEDVLWKLVYRCWVLEPADRLTCQEIIQELQQEGIVREQEGSPDDTVQHTQTFQDAMREDETLLDMDRVRQILNEL